MENSLQPNAERDPEQFFFFKFWGEYFDLVEILTNLVDWELVDLVRPC
jgi:hypothetical protein